MAAQRVNDERPRRERGEASPAVGTSAGGWPSGRTQRLVPRIARPGPSVPGCAAPTVCGRRRGMVEDDRPHADGEGREQQGDAEPTDRRGDQSRPVQGVEMVGTEDRSPVVLSSDQLEALVGASAMYTATSLADVAAQARQSAPPS